MMDEPKKPPTIDEMCASLRDPTTTMLDIIHGCGSIVLMDLATTIFGEFNITHQMTTMALMAGMVLAEVEGRPTDLEKLGGALVTKEDRIKLFMAILEKSFELTMKDRLIYERDNPKADDVEKVM